MESYEKKFDAAVSDALGRGITAEELKKRIDEVNEHDKNNKSLEKN